MDARTSYILSPYTGHDPWRAVGLRGREGGAGKGKERRRLRSVSGTKTPLLNKWFKNLGKKEGVRSD